MDISIIIVNWNSADYVDKCLASIYSSCDGSDVEIIVVDNASYDRCGEIIGSRYPRVKFIQSHENLGFAKANNLGFAQSKGASLLFLNPDTEVGPGSLKIMHDYLLKIEDAGAIGCKLINSDGSLQTSSIQPFPTLLNQMLDAEFLRQKMPNLKIWGIRPLYGDSSLPVVVDVISGACILIKRSVFETIGRFSTDYFMYGEDVDLCYKIKKSGFSVYYTGAVSILHHGGGSTSRRDISTFASVMMLESRRRFFRKAHPSWYAWVYRLLIMLVGLSRIVLMLLIFPAKRFISKEYFPKDIIRRWLAKLRWTVGLEKWIKNY